MYSLLPRLIFQTRSNSCNEEVARELKVASVHGKQVRCCNILSSDIALTLYYLLRSVKPLTL